MTGRWKREDERLRGLFMMAYGAGVALLCGTCTISQWPGLRTIALVVGGAPTAAGLALFAMGLIKFHENQER